MSKLTFLVDNTSLENSEELYNPSPKLMSEHGLSIYIEFEGQKWLIDTGLSDNFLNNAKILGIDISDVDHLILSHGHNDHTGGLKYFLQSNQKADIICSRKILHTSYYSLRHGSPRNISTDRTLFNPDTAWRFKLVGDSLKISDNVYIIFNKRNTYTRPYANKYLKIDHLKDDEFTHEISLVLSNVRGASAYLNIISPCSHNGVGNILESCKDYVYKSLKSEIPNIQVFPSLFVGGMHLPSNCETKNELRELAKQLAEDFPYTKFYTGHCTSLESYNEIKKTLNTRLSAFYTGKKIIF
ncbi:MAG: MBL fold metallo-hydrolase [Bacteroidales bacterium]